MRSGLAGRHLHQAAPGSVLDPVKSSWRQRTIERAEELCRNRLSLFDLEECDLGAEIHWNYEYKALRETPLTFSSSIDYRDYAVTGDCKFVWELNRHQHLVVLGRAYRLTGDRRYAEKVIEHIESWIDQCPFGMGMNWRSPLELAIRLINWVWAYELIDTSGVVTTTHRRRVLPIVYRHLWEITRKYSRYSSANNHLIGEAAGVYVGSSYFACLKPASRWLEDSREILLREIVAQTFDDGGHRELAMGYHLFVIEFFLLAGLAARNLECDFPREYWRRLEAMLDFLAAFVEGGLSIPMFNDCDDGYVLDLSDGTDRARDLLGVGAAIFGRPDFDALADGRGEPAFWLLGQDEQVSGAEVEATPTAHLRSRAMEQSGFYILQCRHNGSGLPVSVTFDCADLGLGSIAAHGHADALSFTLRAFGSDILVDPGTYDYFSHREWRDYFRSTRAHNTVLVDDQDQSEMLGLFLWGRRAKARCLRWEPSECGGTVVGEHDGYARLADPVVHRRTITLDCRRSEATVLDELIGSGQHKAAMHLHFAETCVVRRESSNRCRVECGMGVIVIDLDPGLEISWFHGCEDPTCGWVSRGYHRKTPSTTLAGRCAWTGRLSLATRISIG